MTKPPIARGQKRVAMAIAGVVDLLQIGLLPLLGVGYLLDDALDFLAAFLLIAVCGFKWQFVVAFLLELLPMVDIFPTWTAVVLTLPTQPESSSQGSGGRVHVSAVVVDGQGEPSRNSSGEPGGGEVEGVVVPPVQAPPVRG